MVSYRDVVFPNQAFDYGPVKIRVTVPKSLSVSEANLFSPSADIVWRGDPYGDRRLQVRNLLEEAAVKATRSMYGGRHVMLDLQLERFHALTEKARMFSPIGIHRITLKVRLIDMNSGAQIVPTTRIRADLRALVGSEAHWADRHNQTQRKRIIDHVSKVIQGWLHRGPDPRGGGL